jgi:hypothetical protein
VKRSAQRQGRPPPTLRVVHPLVLRASLCASYSPVQPAKIIDLDLPSEFGLGVGAARVAAMRAAGASGMD